MIERSGYLRDGFASTYERFRPSPPPVLLDILARYAQVPHPHLVVDLGAGTGLSARAWADRADRVAALEANPEMVRQASRAPAANLAYLRAYADHAPVADGSADLVTCAQSFHWMDPAVVLAEAARMLRPGGVFAAYDYDLPPLVHPDVDAAFAAHFDARRDARRRLGLQAGAAYWPKSGHEARIRESGHFRYVREVTCHGSGPTDSERVIGLAESVGGPREFFGGQAPEVDETFYSLRRIARAVLADREVPMVVSYRIRLGVR